MVHDINIHTVTKYAIAIQLTVSQFPNPQDFLQEN